MLKRILTVTAILLLLVVNVCVFAEETDNNYERLLNLGIIDSSYENYANKKNISEKELLKALVRLETGQVVESEDVPEYAKASGIISTINTQEMNSAVSYERALNLALNVAGYSEIIRMNGNDKTAVIKLAGTSGLSSGITLSSGDKLNGTAFIKLLNNLIKTNVINVTMSKGGSSGYSEGDKTVLYYYRNIDKITGQVTQIFDTSLFIEDGCGEGKIAIDEVVYDIDYLYPQELLGQTVYAYVYREGSDLIAYHVESRYSDVKRVDIDDVDILGVYPDTNGANITIRYNVDDREKTLELVTPRVIYNGQNYPSYAITDLQPFCGSISCFDFNNDGKYEVVYVHSYETVIVRNVSELKRTFSNIYCKTVNDYFDYNDKDIDVRVYSEGKKVAFSTIAVNDVLSVAESKGVNKIVTIYVEKKRINGTASLLDNAENKVVIGEEEFEINRTYYDEVNAGTPIDILNTSSEFEFFFDAFGKVAFVKRDMKDGYEYAYLLNQKWNAKRGTAKVRLLNENGDWETLYYAEKVKLNDSNRQNAFVVYDSLSGASGTLTGPELVMIKRDDDGNIMAIKQALNVSATYAPDEFTKVTSGSITRTYASEDQSFQLRHYVKYDAAIFIAPQAGPGVDMQNEDLYSTATAGYFRSGKGYTYVAYNIDEFCYPDAFVVYGTAVAGTTDATIYVNKVYVTLNSDDQRVNAVVGNISGLENINILVSEKLSEEIESGTETIARGDVLEVTLKNAQIQEIKRRTPLPTSFTPSFPADSHSATHDNDVYILGRIKAIDIDRKMLLLDCTASGSSTSQIFAVYIRGESVINIYNQENRKYEVGTMSDIPIGRNVEIKMNGNNVDTVTVYW